MRGYFRIIIFTFTLIAMAVGGFFGYKKLQEYQASQFTKANDKPPIFIALDPIYQPIFRNGHVFENRQFVITLESRPGAPYKIAKHDLPIIRDIIIQQLAALSTRRGPENIDNLDYVRREIIQQIATQLQPGLIFNLAFVGVYNLPPAE
ncbi:MAG: hypothetical protein ORN98_05155 [Alphaproteobacteria bacterium]|nr:hypothetical protein [Alphaproteobacteria bacterium]